MRRAAALEKRGEDGCRVRDHLEEQARRGDEAAIAALAIPECPEEMLFLVECAYELFGRSGVGMGGVNPVSHQEMHAWSLVTDRQLEPHHFAAIRMLDAVLIDPGESKPAPERTEDRSRPPIPQLKRRPEGVEPQFVTPI